MDDRKHITTREVEKLVAATKGSRHEARDRCLLFMMFRHGLRVSEACALQLDQVDVESRVLHVTRLKKGLSTTHPLRGGELRVIRAWLAERARMKPSCRTFFVSQCMTFAFAKRLPRDRFRFPCVSKEFPMCKGKINDDALLRMETPPSDGKKPMDTTRSLWKHDWKQKKD